MEELSDQCVICKSKGKVIAHNVRQVEGCKVYHCHKCDVAYLDKKNTLRDEKEFYNKIYPDSINPEHKGNSPGTIVKRMFELSKKFLAKDKDVLEVGSASGGFLNLVKGNVKSVKGCDLSEEHCIYAKKTYAIDSFNSDIAEIKDSNKYDIIFMFQLFEHISEPHSFLKKLSTLLNENGLVILSVPNINEALFKLYKHEKITNGFFFKLQHPITYSPNALNKLMKMHSFSNIETKLMQNYSISNHLNWIYLSRGNNSCVEGMEVKFETVKKDLHKDIWDKINSYYKELLLERGLSDAFFSVYQKK